MKKKWESAIAQAEDTMSLTRQERVDSHFVSYAHKLNQETTPAKSVPKSPSSAKSKVLVKTPSAVKTPKGATPKTPTSAKGSKASGKSSKNGTPVAPKSSVPVKNYQGSNKRMCVPAGWMSKIVISDGKDQVVYISPEGVEFQVIYYVIDLFFFGLCIAINTYLWLKIRILCEGIFLPEMFINWISYKKSESDLFFYNRTFKTGF